MNSPFTDFIEVASENIVGRIDDQELKTPFVLNDIQSSIPLLENDIPAVTNPLSGSSLDAAIRYNIDSMDKYGWTKYGKDILRLIGVTDDSWITNDRNQNIEFFTIQFANWQDINNFKTNQKGAFGLNNWTYFQKKLGFHNLSNKHAINVDKAIAANKVYEAKTWKDHRNDIYSRLSGEKILPMALPVNDENFAYAVADFQKLKRLTIDGILGPRTFDIMKKAVITPPAPAPVALTPSKWHSIVPDAVQSPAETFVNGNDAFRKMVEIIRTANQPDHFIYLLSGWVVDIDFCLMPNPSKDLAGIDTSTTFRSLLSNAAKSGVEIKMISWNNPKTLDDIAKAETFINNLRIKNNANAYFIKDNLTYGTARMKSIMSEVRNKMDTLNPYLSRLDTWNDWYKQAKAFPNEGSHHEKILVVKGSMGLFAFCGGMDINANRIIGLKGFCCTQLNIPPNPAHNCDLDDKDGRYTRSSRLLHDVHCLVQGNAAEALLKRFVKRWNLHITQFVRTIPPMSDPVLSLSVPIKPTTPFVKVLHTFNHPADRTKADRSILDTVKKAIANASNSIFFEDQYMISPEIASFINKAIRANSALRVKIHTQDDEMANELMFPHKFRGRFRKLLFDGLSVSQKSRIQLMMLDPASVAPYRRRIHSKTYIFDDELAIIGSANCNRRSMTFDSETAVVLFQDGEPSPASFVKKLKADLERDAFNKWVNYRENLSLDAMDLDVKILIHPAYNAVAALMAVTSPLLAYALRDTLAIISALLQRVIDPYPDGEPAIIVKELNEETAEVKQENELLELEANPHQPADSATNEDFRQAELFNENAETDIEPENINPEYFPETENFSPLSDRPCNCNDKKNDHESEEREIAEVIEQQVAVVSLKDATATTTCESHTCWAKTVLNRLIGLNLSMNNTLDEQTKKALEDFQRKNNLLPSQKIDFVTERALLEADSIFKFKGTVSEKATVSVITTAKTKIEDWTTSGLSGIKNKPQHILTSFRDPRKLWAFVLHQMAFKRRGGPNKQYSAPEGYVNTGSHFCIMLDGRIIQLHPMSRMIWHGNCVSPRSVAVEFEGNFPNIKGGWWIDRKSTVQNKDIPTQAQYDAGRFLASYLKVVLGTTHILAHRQSSDSRENDPGPDIWYNVGQWAVDNLGLTDGGSTFKCGTGNPILPAWKTWGNKTNTLSIKEYDEGEEEVEWEELNDESIYIDPGIAEENSQEEDFFFEDNEVLKSISDAVRLNRYYAGKLGWNQLHDKINDLLLPFSGQQNVSLGEEAFAQAASAWQQQQGLSADGIIGPNTWAKMKSFIVPGSTGQSQPTTPVPSSSSTVNVPSLGALGKLMINTSIPVLSKSYPEYQFTAEDAIWLARFVEGEAGGQDNPDSHAVIWAMFNRFGILRHRVPSWTSFAVFLQKYSTTLQPLLNSAGAAQRVWMNHNANPEKFPVVSSNDTYSGTSIKKVQYQRHIDLQKKSWNAFPGYVRNMILRILTGQIPNPGIGIATDFDSTYVFIKTARRKQGISSEPTHEEWKQYTIEHAKSKKVIWIGEKANLNQKKNAFYIQLYLKDVPYDSVKIESAQKPDGEFYETEPEVDYNDSGYYEGTYEYDGSGQEDYVYEIDDLAKDWSNAIRLNQYYANQLAWNQYYNQINDLLLPFSGQQNVSLGEEAFAQAVADWQQQQGFSAKDCDGIIGPKTWARMQSVLNSSPAIPTSSGGSVPGSANTVEQSEWMANPGIHSKYPTWQLYKLKRYEVLNWGISNPAAYIEIAIQEWNANQGIQSHFNRDFDVDHHRSYLNLKRLYQAKGITNPAAYFSANIISVSFFNKRTPAHRNLGAVLNSAQSALIGAGFNFNLASAWSFVPRTFNNNIHKLSNHALGTAIDIDPAMNPHLLSRAEILVIDTVCRPILPSGILVESNPDILKRASDHFRLTFNDAWINQQNQTSVLDAIRNNRQRLNQFASNGFLNLSGNFIRALQNAGLNWGGAWRSSKDFMHFELPRSGIIK